MAARKKGSKSKSKRKPALPSWREVRSGLLQAPKKRLVTCIGKVYLSRAVPRSVKLSIIKVAKAGVKKVTTKRKTKRKAKRKQKAKSRS